MKKFIALVLALTMVFALGGVSVFAADGLTATVEVVETPASKDFVGAKDLNAVGQCFEVAVKLNGITTPGVFSAQTILEWDNDKIEMVNVQGTPIAAATGAGGYLKGEYFPQRVEAVIDEETGEETTPAKGAFDWSKVVFTPGSFNATAFIDTSNPALAEYVESGSSVAGNTSIEFFTVRFKVKDLGDTGLKITKQIVNFAKVNSLESIEIVPADITIGGGPAPVKKTVTAIVAPEVAAEATVGDTVALPATVKATVDGAEEDLAITWTPDAVDTTKAGDVTVKGVVDTKDYVVADGVKIEYEFTVKVKAAEPVKKTVTAIVAPEVVAEATVGDTVALPATVKATVDGAEEELAITWTPATVDTTKVGDVTVKGVVDTKDYVVADGVKTEYEFTVTVKADEPGPGPEIKTIAKINTELPASVDDPANLPTAIEVEYADGTTETINVEWKLTAGGYTFELPENTQLAANVVGADDQPLNVDGGQVVVPVADVDTPITIDDAAIVETAAGTALHFTIKYNPEYEGNLEVSVNKNGDVYTLAEDVWAVYTLFNGNVPVAVGGKALAAGTAFGSEDNIELKDASGIEFDGASVCVITDKNWEDVISGVNDLGNAVGTKNGITK